MEKIYQAVDADGLQIPLTLMRQYGLEQGSGVVLELDTDGIRIVPARLDREAIENRALRYVLMQLGDAAIVHVGPLLDNTGWQAQVFGAGISEPAGVLYYSNQGVLLVERSTPLTEMRRAAGRMVASS